MLTRTTSPTSMNGGTRTRRPVSSTASFIWFVTVAPFVMGVVSVTVSSTTLGNSSDTMLPSCVRAITTRVRLEVPDRIAEQLVGNRQLIEGLAVHEDVRALVGVEILHLAAVEKGRLDFLGGPQTLLDHRAVGEPSQLGLHEGPQVPRRNVRRHGADVQLPLHDKGHPRPHIACFHYRHL